MIDHCSAVTPRPFLAPIVSFSVPTQQHPAMYTPIDDSFAVPPSLVEMRQKNGVQADSARLISPDVTLAMPRTTFTEDKILTPKDFFKQGGYVLSKSMDRAMERSDALEVIQEISVGICDSYLWGTLGWCDPYRYSPTSGLP